MNNLESELKTHYENKQTLKDSGKLSVEMVKYLSLSALLIMQERFYIGTPLGDYASNNISKGFRMQYSYSNNQR